MGVSCVDVSHPPVILGAGGGASALGVELPSVRSAPVGCRCRPQASKKETGNSRRVSLLAETLQRVEEGIHAAAILGRHVNHTGGRLDHLAQLLLDHLNQARRSQ